MSMKTVPAYIERANLAGLPVTFKWTGRLDHIGPVEGTALHDGIEGLNHSAAVLLASELERWAAHRFRALVEPEVYLAQADAAVAWAVDRNYARRGKADEIKEPPAPSAMSMVAELVWDSTRETYWKFPGTRPPTDVVHLAYLVKHTIPKEKAKPFGTWMKWALKRLAELAPRPTTVLGEYESYPSDDAYFQAHRPFFGHPLPPEALDPDFSYKPENRVDLLDRFLQSLDWKANPFLRSPDELKQLGFQGTPYRLG